MEPEEISAVRAVVTEVLERSGDWAAWQAAGLTALPLPEEYGGDGLGLEAVAVLLRESGQRAQRLPAWETLCCAALTLAAHGTEPQRKEHLPAIVEGAVLTPALKDPRGTVTTCAGGRGAGRKVAV
ncbi:acyl-CoA dehydrogenase family protein, partial [Nocardioides pelophilus]|uniref:acyl-CoA dehydrogenase family protein n=1 Tax=Nocardioides pelophilus TaxID=2172019 RepID=UPI0028AB4265